jgi:uncharacterized protein (UPF0305 family)
MGPQFVLVNMRVKFNDTAFAYDIEQVTDFLEQQIRDLFPLVKRVYVKAAVRTVAPDRIEQVFNQS